MVTLVEMELKSSYCRTLVSICASDVFEIVLNSTNEIGSVGELGELNVGSQ